MPTFGKITVGAESATYPGNYKVACRFQKLEAGPITNVTLHTRWSSARAKALIHADLAGEPGALLGVSEEITLGAVEADYDLPFSTPIADAPAGYYWITIKTDGDYDLFWDAGEPNQMAVMPEPYETIVDPFGTSTYRQAAEVSIYATYTTEPPPQHVLTISTTIGGTTSPAPGSHTYDEGATATVTAIPSTGYEFSHWLLDDGTITENPITVTMNMDHSLVAFFTLLPPPTHTLRVEATPVNVPVTLNDSAIGSTPVEVTIEEGEHKVSVPVEVEA